MATVTLELDDETFAALEVEAKAQEQSVADLLLALAGDHARGREAFERGRQYAREDLERYPDVFKRFADS